MDPAAIPRKREGNLVVLHNGVDAEEVAPVTADIDSALPAAVRILGFDFDVKALLLLVEIGLRHHDFSVGRSVVEKGETGIRLRLVRSVIGIHFLSVLSARGWNV